MLAHAARILKHHVLVHHAKLEPPAHARALKHVAHLRLGEAVVPHALGRTVVRVRLVRHEVEDEEHPAVWAEPLREARRREVRVVEVVEARAHAGDVKVGELRVGEGRGGGVGWVEQVADVGGALLGGEALGSPGRWSARWHGMAFSDMGTWKSF